MLQAADEESLHSLAERCEKLGLEVVVRVRDDDELGLALEHVDPEIVLLTADTAEDPADPAKTTRVLTIMLAEEY